MKKLLLSEKAKRLNARLTNPCVHGFSEDAVKEHIKLADKLNYLRIDGKDARLATHIRAYETWHRVHAVNGKVVYCFKGYKFNCDEVEEWKF